MRAHTLSHLRQFLRRAHLYGGMERVLLRELVHRRDDTARAVRRARGAQSRSLAAVPQSRAARSQGKHKLRLARAALADSVARAWDQRLQELNDDLGTALR